jgi:hypothetical protein
MSERNKSVLEVPPIKYSLNYDWGTFSVSTLADEAYELVPLRTEDEQNGPLAGDNRLEDMLGYRINILLVVPGEMEVPDVPLHDQYVNSTWSGNELSVITSFGGTKDSLKDTIMHSILAQISQLGDIEEESLEEMRANIVDEDDIPMDESLSHDLPQMLAHNLSNNVGSHISIAIHEKEQEKFGRESIRRFRRIGMLGLLGDGIILGPPLLEAKPDYPATATALGIFLVLQAIIIGKDFKKFVTNRDTVEAVLRTTSKMQSIKVASDLHASFCRHHFDEQARKRAS